MRKFESEHRQLEVLQTSRPQAVYLNHQLIMLLSNRGVPDEVFLKHQEKMLDALACECNLFKNTFLSFAVNRGSNIERCERYDIAANTL